jgi:hypothetical protein
MKNFEALNGVVDGRKFEVFFKEGEGRRGVWGRETRLGLYAAAAESRGLIPEDAAASFLLARAIPAGPFLVT